MKFYSLKCEIPGSLGQKTVYNKEITPWELKFPHIIFDSWLSGELLMVASCLLITESLMRRIFFEYSGIEAYKSFQLEVSETFKILHPNVKLPNFKWLVVGSNIFVDDIAVGFYNNLYNQLIISDRLWKVLEGVNLGHYAIMPARPQFPPT